MRDSKGYGVSPAVKLHAACSPVCRHSDGSNMHQHLCPSCKQAAVPNLAVRWSCREFPAKCTACGQLSHVIASTSSGIWVVGVVLLLAVGSIALLAQSIWTGLAGLTMVGALNVWAWRRVERWPIAANSAKTAARVGCVATALAWLAILFQ